MGQKRPNDLGLFDPLGDVWNWVADPYAAYPRVAAWAPVPDVGHAVEISDRINLVSRGGSFLDSPAATRSAYRGFDRPSVRDPSVGLRPARTWP